MKNFFKVVLVLIVLFFAAMIIIPMVFKGRIMEVVKTEINKTVNAKVEFDEFDLSLLKNFPNFSASLKGLSVEGIGEFEGDTLVKAGDIRIIINLFDVFKGDSYRVKSIEIFRPQLSLISRTDGAVNWDIALETDEVVPEVKPTEVASAEISSDDVLMLQLNSLEIYDGSLRYLDEVMKVDVQIKGLNHKLSGDLSADFTTLKTNTTIEDFQMDYEGVRYMNDMHIEAKADIDADLKNSIYTFKKNSVRLNNVELGIDGSVAMVGEDINTQLTFKTQKTEFKDLLSMVPALYAQNLEGLTTKGTFSIDGMVKGAYTEESLPAFRLSLNVQDGYIQYPDLPQPISNIRMKAFVENPGGDADNTVVDLENFHLELLGNPMDISLKVKQPISDPYIESRLAGRMNLADISKVYPLDSGDKMLGNFRADIELQGKVSDLDRGNYEDFLAIGSLLVSDFSYATPAFQDEVHIRNAQLNFSPEYLDLVSMKTTIGRNDIAASGKIRNYMAYALKGDKLMGQLKITSHYLNLNDFIPAEEEVDQKEEVAPEKGAQANVSDVEEIPLEVIEIPGNIAFVLASKIDSLLYDNLIMTNVIGIINIDDHRASLQNLSMQALQGKMALNGYYDTKNPKQPDVHFTVGMTNVSIQESYKTFASFEALVPVAENTHGNFSTNFDMQLKLDNKMEPDLNSLQAAGTLKTSALEIKSGNALTKLAEQLKMNQLKSIKTDPVNISFIVEDGKVNVKPFDIRFGSYTGVMSGYTSLDRSMNYDLTLAIPLKDLGSSVNDVLAGLSKQGIKIGNNEKVNVGIKIIGTVENPKVSADLSQAAGNAAKSLQKQAEEEFNRQKKEMEDKARAELEKKKKEAADQIKKETDKKKKEAEKKAKEEADKLKKKMEDEAKKALEGWF